MDQPTFFLTIFGIMFVMPFIITVIVAIVGCVCLTPEEMLRIVFPFIRKSGNHNVIFGFIIPKKTIKYLYCYLTFIVAFTLADIFCNIIVTISFTYNPYDGLDCYGYYLNGTKINVTSEEQAQMIGEGNGIIICVGWNFDVGGAIGHTVSLLTLVWILVYIVLWIKIKWWDKILNCFRNRQVRLGKCCFRVLIISQIFFIICTTIAILGGDSSIYLLLTSFGLSPKGTLDVTLIVIVLNSGMAILPGPKKSKSLGDYCKEAVENNQGEEEGALVPIRNRLRGSRVHEHQIEIDLLVELAELECKKALGDMYHYGTEDRRYNITENEMKTIAQVAYHKITNDGGDQYNNGQQYNTRQGASINVPTERDRLLGNTRRNNNNYSHFN